MGPTRPATTTPAPDPDSDHQTCGYIGFTTPCIGTNSNFDYIDGVWDPGGVCLETRTVEELCAEHLDWPFAGACPSLDDLRSGLVAGTVPVDPGICAEEWTCGANLQRIKFRPGFVAWGDSYWFDDTGALVGVELRRPPTVSLCCGTTAVSISWVGEPQTAFCTDALTLDVPDSTEACPYGGAMTGGSGAPAGS